MLINFFLIEDIVWQWIRDLYIEHWAEITAWIRSITKELAQKLWAEIE